MCVRVRVRVHTCVGMRPEMPWCAPNPKPNPSPTAGVQGELVSRVSSYEKGKFCKGWLKGEFYKGLSSQKGHRMPCCARVRAQGPCMHARVKAQGPCIHARDWVQGSCMQGV